MCDFDFTPMLSKFSFHRQPFQQFSNFAKLENCHAAGDILKYLSYTL